MSGIQVHTADPISPAKATKATAITPQTAYTLTTSNAPQPATTTAVPSSNGYTPAQPGQAAPMPTRTIAQPTNYGPPPPQPGAFPQPAPPAATAKATLPPPPKAGETPKPAAYYAPAPTAVPSLPQPYPPQMSQPPLGANLNGIPPPSTTNTTNTPSYQPSAPPTTLPLSSSDAIAGRASLEHPPGYVQNQFATEMTAEQRFAQIQQGENNASAPPESVLGYVQNRSRAGSSASAVTGGEIWEGAKKWVSGVGEKVGEVEGKTWEWINGRK